MKKSKPFTVISVIALAVATWYTPVTFASTKGHKNVICYPSGNCFSCTKDGTNCKKIIK